MHMFKTWDKICCEGFINYSHTLIFVFYILCNKDRENMVRRIGTIEPPIKFCYLGFARLCFPHLRQVPLAKLWKFFKKFVTDLVLRSKGYINQRQVLRCWKHCTFQPDRIHL